MFAVDQSYIISFYLTLNKIFIDDEYLNIKTFSSIFGESTRSLNRHMRQSCGYTPMQIINAIRFYSAFKKLQNGDSIEDILYSIKIESISYFYKMFKKYFKMRPSEVKIDINNIHSEKELEAVSSLSCNIERYNFYKSNLNEGLAQLMSHEDFKEITYNKINLDIVKNTIWRYNFY